MTDSATSTTVSAITIDASALADGINWTGYISDQIASAGSGSYKFYGGTPDRAFGGTYYMNGSQIAYSYAGSNFVVLLDGADFAYDFLHYGSSYGHGLSGTVTSITLGLWVEGTTATQGTGEAGEVSGLQALVTITGLDLEVAAGTGATGNLLNTLFNQLQSGNATGLYDLLDDYPQVFVGTAGADSYTGTAFADTLTGGAGNDTLTGGAGDDLVQGGDGADTAVYSGNKADYGWTYTGSGTWTVTGTDGTDTVTGIETVQYADGTEALVVPNSAPTGLALAASSVAEDAAVGTVVGSLSATDADNDTLTYSLVGESALFEIVGNEVRLKGALDFETATSHQISVQVSDGKGGETTSAVSIAVSDVAESSGTSSAITIDASALADGINWISYISDQIASAGSGSYKFYGGTPDRAFGGTYYMNGSQIVYSYAGSNFVVLLDGADFAYDFLHYGSSYGHGLSGTVTSITLGLWVEGTTATQGTGEAGEVSGLQALVTITGLDLEVAAGTGATGNLLNTLFNQLQSGNATGLYDLLDDYPQVFVGTAGADSYTGTAFADTLTGGAGNDTLTGGAGADTAVLSGNKADYDWASNADGTWTVTDTRTGGQTDGVDLLSGVEALKFADGTVTLGVEGPVPRNSAPVITSSGGAAAAALGVAEGALAVAALAATDADAGDTLAWSIAGGADAALFSINAATGALTFVTAADYEAPADSDRNNVYDVVVRVTDAGGLIADQTLAVTVADVNEVLVITSSAAVSVAENTGLVTTVTAADPEGAAVSYAILGGADGALFAIDPATGALSFVSAADYETPKDADGDNVYEVTVSATDAGGLAATRAIAVTVTDVAGVLVSGTTAADRLVGTDEDDTLDGGSGADRLAGGAGDDTYVVDSTGDRVIETAGAGTDLVQSSVSFRLAAHVENLTLTGATAINGTGNGLDNVGIGNSAANRLMGGAGADTLAGGAGNDTLDGSTGNDVLRGGGGADLLRGGTGNDTLSGGIRADSLHGGAGEDTFLFRSVKDSTALAWGRDTIFDFDGDGGDQIDLSGIDASTKTTGDQSFSFVGTADFSGTAGELRVEQTASDTLLYGDVTGDGQADFSIRLSGVVSVLESHFVL